VIEIFIKILDYISRFKNISLSKEKDILKRRRKMNERVSKINTSEQQRDIITT
jgi:hypothetical protein